MTDSYPGDPDVDYSADPAASGIAVGTASGAFNYALTDATTGNSVSYSTTLGSPAQAVASEVLSTDGASPPPLKPGWQTTEFWTTHIFSLLSLATALGWIGPNFSKDHEPVVNAVALVASVLAPAVYAHSRGLVKRAHQQAVAQVISSATAPPAV